MCRLETAGGGIYQAIKIHEETYGHPCMIISSVVNNLTKGPPIARGDKVALNKFDNQATRTLATLKPMDCLSEINQGNISMTECLPKHLQNKFATLAFPVSPHLKSLFRWSIHHETVYQGWKLSRVSPIFKKDDSTNSGNYRPVSILSVPSKLLESDINTVIVNHVMNNNLITPNQWAYRKVHSTELLLIHLTEKWRRFVDDGLTVAVAFVDFRKAFDSALHSHLLDKLHGQFGIDGELYAWMDSYLSTLKQFTMINGKESSKMHVRCGVPQGSVLGPTLFTLYTNDLPSFIKSGDTSMYADDTTVFSTGSSQDVACNLLNCALEELFTWCVNNRLTPHPSKC